MILSRGEEMKPLKTTISITLDEPILTNIRVLAEEDDRSVSSFINLVLKDYLERLKREKSAP